MTDFNETLHHLSMTNNISFFEQQPNKIKNGSNGWYLVIVVWKLVLTLNEGCCRKEKRNKDLGKEKDNVDLNGKCISTRPFYNVVSVKFWDHSTRARDTDSGGIKSYKIETYAWIPSTFVLFYKGLIFSLPGKETNISRFGMVLLILLWWFH